MSTRLVYLDNAATTTADKEVLDTYKGLLVQHFANSDSLYDIGSIVSTMMEKSRKVIAGLLEVNDKEVLFTSGASEANNMAIKGIAFACMQDKKHCITTTIEHSSVKNAFKQLEEVFGFEVTRLSVDEFGLISVEELRSALRKDTALVSIMHVNNEIGVIQPIDEIAEIVKKQSGAYMHVDMVQALGKLRINLKNIDVATFSAHKIHGLKGSGLCIKKNHVPLVPLISGGQQEFMLRGGTENALVNIMFAKTLRLAISRQENVMKHCMMLKQYLISELQKIEQIKLNTPNNSVCHIVNFSTNVPSEIMMNALNKKGIAVSAQSTCSSKTKNASDVLLALNKSYEEARSSIRCSFSIENTKEDIEYLIENMKECIKKYGN